MKKIALFSGLMLVGLYGYGQALKPIELLRPDLSRGKNAMMAFSERASVQNFDTTMLSLRDMSDLLWAANGINRPQSGKRTAPSAMNTQEVAVYMCTSHGIYLYDAQAHVLNPVAEGDYRNLVAGMQTWAANAPLICLLVADTSKFPRGDETLRNTWAAIDVGIVSQNISLFCASVGIGTRPRASMDTEKLTSVLKLGEHSKVLLNHPVGYGKK
ncbi:MAG: SagB/ThcOx family dehydrogenase [Breznakibacter sp.]